MQGLQDIPEGCRARELRGALRCRDISHFQSSQEESAAPRELLQLTVQSVELRLILLKASPEG